MTRLAAIIWILLIATSSGSAQVKLPALVRDSMVLQRDLPVTIWGWASVGEKIRIRFNQKSYQTKAGPDGKWSVQLSPMKAGGPYTMTIEGKNRISLNDILIGDVWLCSGQSNMVHYLGLHRDRYEKEIATANYPQIRQFLVPAKTNFLNEEEDLPSGHWKSANPQDLLQFSVVAYFFARQIHEKYHIPIGLINASVGGSPIEAWMSEEALKNFPEAFQTLQRNHDTAWVNRVNGTAAAQNEARLQVKDEGLAAKIPWYDTGFNAGNWNKIQVPGYWEDQGIRDLDGIVWYRKEINLPPSLAGLPARLDLGRIVDADVVYLNGKQVGTTGYQYPQRRYQVPAGLLKPGKNILTIRVMNYGGRGGFVYDKPYELTVEGKKFDLKGEWQYQVGAVYPPPQEAVRNIQPEYQPAALFNGMVAPLRPFAIKGILWYQGESNTHQPREYEKLFPAMIADWRKQWRQNQLPFLFVQLPNFGDRQYLPSESNWAALREAQRKTLSVHRTGMAVTIDLGEWNDLHPGRKKEVGERLAIEARRSVYGEKHLSGSPLPTSATSYGNKVYIGFGSAANGLVSAGTELNGFAIAGADKKFLWARARIQNDTVVVWNESVTSPAYVRYAWADHPINADLYNTEGLPASPFEIGVRPASTAARGPWQGKKCAVVLTYDDGLQVHLSKVIPALDAAGLKGTFYISDHMNLLQSQIGAWRKAAANGHELANHTLHHPCAGGPGRDFVQPDYDLNRYTVNRMVNEIRLMNTLLRAIDGKSERTFAYPCGDRMVNDTFYIETLRNELVAARGVREDMPLISSVDLYNIGTYLVNGQSGAELIGAVKQAMEKNAMVVFLFHGVGGEHSLNVSEEAHGELLEFLKQHQEEIWVAPMIDVARYIRAEQTKSFSQ